MVRAAGVKPVSTVDEGGAAILQLVLSPALAGGAASTSTVCERLAPTSRPTRRKRASAFGPSATSSPVWWATALRRRGVETLRGCNHPPTHRWGAQGLRPRDLAADTGDGAAGDRPRGVLHAAAGSQGPGEKAAAVTEASDDGPDEPTPEPSPGGWVAIMIVLGDLRPHLKSAGHCAIIR
jgi:hypothetical protein